MDLGEDDPPFLPYTEFAKFPQVLPSATSIRHEAHQLLRRHLTRRPEENPVRAFATAFPAQAEQLAARPFAYFHKYAFNTLRQLGANFELCASHLDWLDPEGGLAEASRAALGISEMSKLAQFQLARAVTRKKFDALNGVLAPAIDAWDELMGSLDEKLAG